MEGPKHACKLTDEIIYISRSELLPCIMVSTVSKNFHYSGRTQLVCNKQCRGLVVVFATLPTLKPHKPARCFSKLSNNIVRGIYLQLDGKVLGDGVIMLVVPYRLSIDCLIILVSIFHR